MNYSIIERLRCLLQTLLAPLVLAGSCLSASAQSCPANVPVTITTNPDTYYPGLDNTLPIGSTSILLGASGSGTSPINSGDLLLLIQMQGAQIDSTNTSGYGDGISGGSANGYLSNAAMLAGNMEYVVASSNVPLSGGSLSLMNGTVKEYRNANFSAYGQYRFQVIRVGLFYDLTLGATINTPSWNGTTGGITVISVTNQLDFNGQTVDATASGFRGGGGRQLSGGAGGLLTDFVTLSSSTFNGSKGEGIAGTPRFLNNLGSLLDAGILNEGYPAGSFAAGAPGTGGGGGTDANPASNDQNSGGGGGANGAPGGRGGNSWSSNLATGGEPGALFAERTPSRLVMGGGGGAGTTNNGTGTPAGGFASSGAAGGGIVLITANSIVGSGTVTANGATAYTTTVNDGSGGGGAGGSIMIYANSGLSAITVSATGGNGGSNAGGGSPPPHGPGGGGSGGLIFSNAPFFAATASGGTSGNTTGGIVFGSAPGTDGIVVQGINQGDVPPQGLNCSILPIRFITTAANLKNARVSVNWRVANEGGVERYDVEKSSDGKNFEVAGSIAYQSGRGAETEYSFVDKSNLSAPLVYYRIRGIFKGGASLYSVILSVRNDGGALTNSVTVSPNPATGASATVRLSVINPGNVQVRILSAGGTPVWQKQITAKQGINSVNIDNLSSLPNGVYFLQCMNGGQLLNDKMIITR